MSRCAPPPVTPGFCSWSRAAKRNFFPPSNRLVGSGRWRESVEDLRGAERCTSQPVARPLPSPSCTVLPSFVSSLTVRMARSSLLSLAAPQGGHGSQRGQHHGRSEGVAHRHAAGLPLCGVEADGPAHVSPHATGARPGEHERRPCCVKR